MSTKRLLSRHSFAAFSLILMLELLHLSIWFEFGSDLSRAMILVHFGLFLIWQPLWRGDESLSLLNATLFILATLAFVAWINLWLIFVWIILLIGFLGGFIKQGRSDQLTYMITLAFLISELLFGVTTQIFEIKIDKTVSNLFFYGLLLLPLVLVFFIKHQSPGRGENVDLLRAISSSLLISLVALGSLLNMYHTGSEYLTALIEIILAISLSLIIISWLLSPRLGFSGLSQIWSQSLLNIGSPFELWLSRISNLNQELIDPDEFLDAAMFELTHISWIRGVTWEIDGKNCEHGHEDRYKSVLRVNDLRVVLQTRLVIGGALFLHCNLLIKIIENLYVSKLKERELNQQTHLQSIYEAGARITHDIKNLLQSLKTLTSIVEQKEALSDEKQKLIRSQLPHLSQRLQLALDKLQSPHLVELQERDIASWYIELKNRLDAEHVYVTAEIQNNVDIPAELFDSVIDNLLENITQKRQLEAGIESSVVVISNADEISVTVTDTGSKIPDEIARRFFDAAVDSENGLGIGIYQASRQAESCGYSLQLIENREQQVSFRLSKQSA